MITNCNLLHHKQITTQQIIQNLSLSYNKDENYDANRLSEDCLFQGNNKPRKIQKRFLVIFQNFQKNSYQAYSLNPNPQGKPYIKNQIFCIVSYGDINQNLFFCTNKSRRNGRLQFFCNAQNVMRAFLNVTFCNLGLVHIFTVCAILYFKADGFAQILQTLFHNTQYCANLG